MPRTLVLTKWECPRRVRATRLSGTERLGRRRCAGVLDTVDACPNDPGSADAKPKRKRNDCPLGLTCNRQLSKSRAESVRTWLVKNGIDSTQLTAAGFGPDRPIDSNETELGRKNNRRVELHVAASPTPSAAVVIPAGATPTAIVPTDAKPVEIVPATP
jgi:hypothetical protein